MRERERESIEHKSCEMSKDVKTLQYKLSEKARVVRRFINAKKRLPTKKRHYFGP